jgi:hypothetical protein
MTTNKPIELGRASAETNAPGLGDPDSIFVHLGQGNM